MPLHREMRSKAHNYQEANEVAYASDKSMQGPSGSEVRLAKKPQEQRCTGTPYPPPYLFAAVRLPPAQCLASHPNPHVPRKRRQKATRGQYHTTEYHTGRKAPTTCLQKASSRHVSPPAAPLRVVVTAALPAMVAEAGLSSTSALPGLKPYLIRVRETAGCTEQHVTK